MSEPKTAPGMLDPDTCRPDRLVLRDPELRATSDAMGYVVVPLIDADEVGTLPRTYLDAVTSEQGINPEGALVTDHLEPVLVRAGGAVILDDAVIHQSPPNRTDARAGARRRRWSRGGRAQTR